MAIELGTPTTLKFQYDEDAKTVKEDEEDLDGFSVDEEDDEDKDEEEEGAKEEESYLE